MKTKKIYDIKKDTASITHIGKIRLENEDNFGYIETVNGDIFVICDGMGGHIGGKQASAIAVESIIHFFSKKHPDILIAIRDAIKFANRRIYETAQKNLALNGMGTTIVLVVVQDDKIFIGHVGDSRVYLLSDNKLYRLTKDHSFVQEMYDKGILTYEEMLNHSRKNEITKALGLKQEIEPEITVEPLKLKNGDKLLLCSDGLTDMVDDESIKQILVKNDDVKLAAKELLNLALANGGRDNITLQIIKITNSNYKNSLFENKFNTGIKLPENNLENTGDRKISSKSKKRIKRKKEKEQKKIEKKDIVLIGGLFILLFVLIRIIMPIFQQKNYRYTILKQIKEEKLSNNELNKLKDTDSLIFLIKDNDSYKFLKNFKNPNKDSITYIKTVVLSNFNDIKNKKKTVKKYNGQIFLIDKKLNKIEKIIDKKNNINIQNKTDDKKDSVNVKNKK